MGDPLTDEEMLAAFANSYSSMTTDEKRDELMENLMKVATGSYVAHTIGQIMDELGLTRSSGNLGRSVNDRGLRLIIEGNSNE